MGDLVAQVSEKPSVGPVLCVMGPTASGKTALALALAHKFQCERISVDSAQVYRGMDIGTAKLSVNKLADAPHWLINIRDPWESYSAGDFCRDAVEAILDIRARGRMPLLVGGTMLYFRMLQDGLAELPGPDLALRAELDARAEKEGWVKLHAELAELDPQSAERLQPTDRQRIQRALEICLLSGEPASELQRNTQSAIHADYLNIGLIPKARDVLHARIAERLMQMRQDGFMGEIRALAAKSQMHRDAPAMRAVGYRQLWSCLAGECTEDEAFEKALFASRRLAKRQLTWLRSWPDLMEIDTSVDAPVERATHFVREWLDSRATSGRNG